MNEIIKLNNDLVCREDDNAFFDAVNFKVYKFNDAGFKLLSILGDKKMDLTAWKKAALSKGVDLTDFENFVTKCEKYKIVLPQNESQSRQSPSKVSGG